MADQLIEWIDGGAADGFIYGAPVLGNGLSDWIENVLPILESKGYYNKAYTGATLRENLGLAYKHSQYEKQPLNHN
ncbi:putative monooxygenase MoxC [compost metagenome]